MSTLVKTVAIVWGNGLNANTIVQSLKGSAFCGEIYILRETQASTNFADWLNRDVTSRSLDECSVSGLLREIARCSADDQQVFLFLTDERFHADLAQLSLSERLPPNLVLYLGSVENMKTILDRFEFCRFIDSNEFGKVPRTIYGEEDPVEVFGNRFILRPRVSWKSPLHRERVQIIDGRKAWEHAIHELQAKGLGSADLCYQEMLSIKDEHNVSICGWFGKTHRHVFCTRKVLQHPPGIGDGDVIERIDPPNGVLETAESILVALDYNGPFELEFVLDANDMEYKVIELNPRFWLQHGLVEALSAGALIGRYMGLSNIDTPFLESSLRYWVHPLYALFRCLKCDLAGIRYLRQTDKSWTPMGIRASLALLPRLALATLRRKMVSVEPN